MTTFFTIYTSGIFRLRYVSSRDGRSAMYRLGIAEMNAEQTVRPAFREMIDTIVWGDIR